MPKVQVANDDMRYMGGFLKLGVPFAGPYNKDYSILGSILGSPYFGKLPHELEPKLIRGGYVGD